MQIANAQFWVDHVTNLFCEIDGVPVSDLAGYRVTSPQISFNAPSPWIQGETGGEGKSSGEGYYLFLSPFSPGRHTLHFGGRIRLTKRKDGFDFSAEIDMTYHLTVTGPQG